MMFLQPLQFSLLKQLKWSANIKMIMLLFCLKLFSGFPSTENSFLWLTRPFTIFTTNFSNFISSHSPLHYMLATLACVNFLNVLNSFPLGVLYKLLLLLIIFFPRLFRWLAPSHSGGLILEVFSSSEKLSLTTHCKSSPSIIIYHSNLLFPFYNSSYLEIFY